MFYVINVIKGYFRFLKVLKFFGGRGRRGPSVQ